MHGSTAALRAWRSYRGAGLGTRLFLGARLVVLPRRALLAEFPFLRGHILGAGSGHGLIARWIAELNPAVTLVGVDTSPRRVALARATQAGAPRVELRLQDVLALDARETFDAAVAVDLMHHVPLDQHAALAAALARALGPGAVLLVKDVARTPRWKYAFNRVHDLIVAREWIDYGREPEETAALFEAAGFTTERLERVMRLSPYPHYLLRMRRRP